MQRLRTYDSHHVTNRDCLQLRGGSPSRRGESPDQLHKLLPEANELSQARRCYRRYGSVAALGQRTKSWLMLIFADIKALTASTPNVVSALTPAFERYNEEQLATVKLPGSSQPVRRPLQMAAPQVARSRINLYLSMIHRYSSANTILSETDDITMLRAHRALLSITAHRHVWTRVSDEGMGIELTVKQKASSVQSHVIEGPQADLV